MSGKLSLEEWKKLSEEGKIERYKDLSNHDRFLVRVGVGAPPPRATVVGSFEMTEEEKRQADKDLEKILKEAGAISSDETLDELIKSGRAKRL